MARLVLTPSPLVNIPAAGNGIADQQLVVGEALPEAINVAEAFTGTVDSYSLDPTSDALPAGLSLSGSFIDGTPSAAAGPLSIVIRATNAAGHVTTTFTLTTFAVPTVTGSIANVDRNHDGSTAFTVATAAEFTGTVTSYSISAPSGIEINSATGEVSIGAYDYTAAAVQVFALNGPAQSAALAFTVDQLQAGPWPIEAVTFSTGSLTLVSPAGQPGDMLVIAAHTSLATPGTLSSSGADAVQGGTGDLSYVSDNAIGQVFYIKLTEATTGLTLTASSAAIQRMYCWNIGPHSFAASGQNVLGGGTGDVNFPTLTGLEAKAKILYYHVRRIGDGATVIDGTGSLASDPFFGDPENPVFGAEYSINSGKFLVDIMTLDAAGSSPTVTFVNLGAFRNTRGGIAIAFNPDPQSSGVALPGQYIADDNGVGLARSSNVSSFDIEDATFTLSETAQVGHYIAGSGNLGLGEIWVKPIAPATTVTISSYTPAYGTGADGRLGNGAMLNMAPTLSPGGQQGFAQTAGNNPTFNAALVAGSPPGQNIVMSPGDVLVVGPTLSTQSADGRQVLDNVVYIHCVDHVPYDDEFAPPYVWHASLGARPRYRYSDITEGAIPSLSTAGFTNALPTVSTLEAAFQRRLLDFHGSQDRYGMRAWRQGVSGSNYGRDILNEAVDPAAAYIISDQPIAAKRRIIQGLVQRGIDAYGAVRSAYASGLGRWMGSDGGHQSGRKASIVIAGHLLGDTTMRDWVKTNTSPFAASAMGEDGMRYYLTPTVITATQEPGWQGNGNVSLPDIVYEDAMGVAPVVPEWVGTIAVGGVIVPSSINNIWTGFQYYRNTGHAEVSGGVTAALLVMGLRTAWGHDPFFDYHARHHAISVYGDDPWRYVDGVGTPRYDLIDGAPAGTAGVPTDWRREMYHVHCFQSPTYYEFPTGVNDFNGAT